MAETTRARRSAGLQRQAMPDWRRQRLQLAMLFAGLATALQGADALADTIAVACTLSQTQSVGDAAARHVQPSRKTFEISHNRYQVVETGETGFLTAVTDRQFVIAEARRITGGDIAEDIEVIDRITGGYYFHRGYQAMVPLMHRFDFVIEYQGTCAAAVPGTATAPSIRKF